MPRPQISAPPNNPSFRSIPFVAGKSLSNSHNLGITIQQTKSLISTKLNKNPKKKPQPKPQPHQLESSNAKSSTTIISTKQKNANNICPVLKYNKSKINFSVNQDDGNVEETPEDNKQSIEEIWADYMYEIESKNVIPIKCTCFPVKTKNQKQKSSRIITEAQLPSRTRVNPSSTIILEAKKMMNKCRKVQKAHEDDVISKDDMSSDEERKKKPTKSIQLAKYMRQMKEIQGHLKG